MYQLQKLLDQLNDEFQNVSAKAASNELLIRKNQAEITKLAEVKESKGETPLSSKNGNDVNSAPGA